MVEWFDRMKNIFSREVDGVTEWVDSPGELGTERVRELAEQYGFDYVLADRRAAAFAADRLQERRVCRLPHQQLK